MADVLQRADDPRVAPRRILFGHPHDQSPDLREHARTTAPPLRVRPFPRDELPMPPKNRVGRDDRGDVTQAATAQPVSMHRQPTAFLIGQADPAAHVPAQDAVFFDQVGHGVLLPLVEPADQRGQQQAERQRVEHGARVYTTDPISGPEDPRPSNETLRGHRLSFPPLQPTSQHYQHNLERRRIDHEAELRSQVRRLSFHTRSAESWNITGARAQVPGGSGP